MVLLDQLWSSWEAIAKEIPVRDVVVTKLGDYMRFTMNLLVRLKLRKDARAEGLPWPPVSRSAQVRWWKDSMRRAGALPPAAAIDATRDAACFVYTGGTTGLSKGVMLSHYNVVSNVRQVSPCITDFVKGRDGVMCILPFFHSFGMVAMNFGIAQGGKLVLLPRFELRRALAQLARERPSFFPGVPRLFLALSESPETRKYDLSSVKACISGAAPLPQAVADRFREVTGGAKLVEGFGLTECSPVTHVNPFDAPHPGTIGIPILDTDCKIVDLDERNREVAPGERGELCVRGPQVMLGYWGKPEATADVLRNGWLHTGDIAVMDEEGYFRIVDRMKDLIIVSGFNVYPTEVEEVLYGHPKVLKCCVVGVHDETTGEAVKAFVVTKPGETVTAEELEAWCRDPERGLTGYRVPKRWEFRDSLPETLVGKVLRRVLLEQERQSARQPAT
jgi:long-chain acyl-CoA synthetase